MASRELNVGPSVLQQVLCPTESSPQASWKVLRKSYFDFSSLLYSNTIKTTVDNVSFSSVLSYPFYLFIYMYTF